jgi:LysM repeat protein
MNNPNPLIPQGSLLEQKAKGKPHLRVAYIIVAVHLVFLGGLLIQGCGKEHQADLGANSQTNDTTLPPLPQGNLYPTNVAMASNTTQSDLTATAPSASTPAPTLPPPSALEAVPAVVPREYVVVHGDNFTTIGKKFNVSAGAVARANPGVDSTRLKVGQKLAIPAPASTAIAVASAGDGADSGYVVKTGDTLSKIATAHATTITEIKALNGLRTDRIKVGDKLKLPAAKGASTTASPAATGPGTPASSPPGGTGNI